MTEKDVLGWALESQKHIAHLYLATAEHTDSMPLLRELFAIMQEEHEMRMQIYQMMHQRGWYSPRIIEESQLQQAKNQFSSMRGRLQQQAKNWQQQGWQAGQMDWQQQGLQQGSPNTQQGRSGWSSDQQQFPQQHWNPARPQGPQGSAYNPS